MPSIPHGWYDYTRFGEVVIDRFIPLKVPLSEDKISVPRAERFTPSDVMRQTNLGLVIDLTNTWRYYDSREFISNGIYHEKLSIPGKIVPHNHLVQRFIGIVKRFLDDSSSEGKLIGVHCTHGLNRTGYLICAYMIQELGYDPLEAIQLFNAKRGHEMERDNYLQSLRRMVPGNRQDPVQVRERSGRQERVSEAQYSAGWQRHDRSPEYRAPRGQDSAGWRQDRSLRRYDSPGWRQDRSLEASPRYDDGPRRAYNKPLDKYNDNYPPGRGYYTTEGESEMAWDPKIRRIVRVHNFRVPSYRNAFAKETGTHTRFD